MLGKIMRIMNLTENEIINHPTLLVNVVDQQHRILFWNKKCEEFFCIKEQEALGKRLEDLVPHIRGHKKMDRLDEALSGKEVFITDEKYDTKDYYYTQFIFPIKNHNGKVVAAANIVRFIPTTETIIRNDTSEMSQAHFVGSI